MSGFTGLGYLLFDLYLWYVAYINPHKWVLVTINQQGEQYVDLITYIIMISIIVISLVFSLIFLVREALDIEWSKR
jgi:uncharacterized BrkB/YihY/UPF0761 family membrane protein